VLCAALSQECDEAFENLLALRLPVVLLYQQSVGKEQHGIPTRRATSHGTYYPHLFQRLAQCRFNQSGVSPHDDKFAFSHKGLHGISSKSSSSMTLQHGDKLMLPL